MLRSSLATVVGLAVHYLCFYVFGIPLWTDAIAEWIMAHTPSRYAVPILQMLGPWAKPFAITGGLAFLGFGVQVIDLVTRKLPNWTLIPITMTVAGGFGWFFDYSSIGGQVSFWLFAAAPLAVPFSLCPASRDRGIVICRRRAIVMAGATVGVALEGFARNRLLAQRAVRPVSLPPPIPHAAERSSFAPGLVRKAITPLNEFYGMSKNSVDPLLDPKRWRLKITENGRTLREFTFAELLSLPRTPRFQTLRCISNTLKSDLMGTAHWSGIFLRQLVDPGRISPSIQEVAIIGVDGHGDSLALPYAFSEETMFALAMNGQTLNRDHGFPIRMLVPRYYGLKNVKWISEIAFVEKPYFGTWPKMGYTKEPLIHTASHVDHYTRAEDRLRVGGVSFAGVRGIKAVQVRLDNGSWVDAALEPPLSGFTLTRWIAELPAAAAGSTLQVRAQDGTGEWQSERETPLFPDGVDGPTKIKLTS